MQEDGHAEAREGEKRKEKRGEREEGGDGRRGGVGARARAGRRVRLIVVYDYVLDFRGQASSSLLPRFSLRCSFHAAPRRYL